MTLHTQVSQIHQLNKLTIGRLKTVKEVVEVQKSKPVQPIKVKQKLSEPNINEFITTKKKSMILIDQSIPKEFKKIERISKLVSNLDQKIESLNRTFTNKSKLICWIILENSNSIFDKCRTIFNSPKRKISNKIKLQAPIEFNKIVIDHPDILSSNAYLSAYEQKEFKTDLNKVKSKILKNEEKNSIHG